MSQHVTTHRRTRGVVWCDQPNLQSLCSWGQWPWCASWSRKSTTNVVVELCNTMTVVEDTAPFKMETESITIETCGTCRKAVKVHWTEADQATCLGGWWFCRSLYQARKDVPKTNSRFHTFQISHFYWRIISQNFSLCCQFAVSAFSLSRQQNDDLLPDNTTFCIVYIMHLRSVK